MGEFDLLLNHLREKFRVKNEQKAESDVALWTAKASVGATTVRLGGVDGNKKVKGIKRHVVVDRNGFLIAVMVTIACVHDGKAAYLLAGCLKELCCNIKVILADAGYRGEVADKIKKALNQ